MHLPEIQFLWKYSHRNWWWSNLKMFSNFNTMMTTIKCSTVRHAHLTKPTIYHVERFVCLFRLRGSRASVAKLDVHRHEMAIISGSTVAVSSACVGSTLFAVFVRQMFSLWAWRGRERERKRELKLLLFELTIYLSIDVIVSPHKHTHTWSTHIEHSTRATLPIHAILLFLLLVVAYSATV